jgi:hypothetical protein
MLKNPIQKISRSLITHHSYATTKPIIPATSTIHSTLLTNENTNKQLALTLKQCTDQKTKFEIEEIAKKSTDIISTSLCVTVACDTIKIISELTTTIVSLSKEL